jgi:hypothetical protein
MSLLTPAQSALIRPLLAGPFARRSVLFRIAGIVVVLVATLLTCVGGCAAWPAYGALALPRPRRIAWPLAAAVALAGYAVATLALAPALANVAGRIALPCDERGPLRPQSTLYYWSNRHYVTPALHAAVLRIAAQLQRDDPRTVVRYLDGGFPLGGLPLLPHLSHADGRRLDLALLYRDAGTPLPRSRWPLGYFAYVAPAPGASACPPRWFDLRWDFGTLQPWLPIDVLDEARTRRLLQAALAERATGKVLLEPHLQQRLGLRHPKLRFQGCDAARHDDHLHLQL